MKLLSLLLLPSLALSASVTGTVTLLDGTPLGGAVVKVGADSVVSLANGSFTLGRSTGIASKSGKTIPVTSHLAIENGRPRLSFGGFDITGRARPATVSANTETPSSQTFGARSMATRDTFKLVWNGKRLFVFPVATDTTVAFKIDTAWKDDAGIPWNPRVSYGSLFDARDGQTYRTVVIGNQRWMAENLNFKVDSSRCYDNDTSYCRRYGRLYTWASAMALPDSMNYRSVQTAVITQGICPDGYHVPSRTTTGRSEPEQFIAAIESNPASGEYGINAGKILKARNGWGGERGTDYLGFRALPTASYTFGGATDFWTAIGSSVAVNSNIFFIANTIRLYYDYTDITMTDYLSRDFHHPLRCIANVQ